MPYCPGTQAGLSAPCRTSLDLPGRGKFPDTGKEGNLSPQPKTNKAVFLKLCSGARARAEQAASLRLWKLPGQ